MQHRALTPAATLILLAGAATSSRAGAPNEIELSALDGSNGFTLTDPVDGFDLGFAVSSAGDINGDGITDLLIGDYFAYDGVSADTGRAYIIFGAENLGSAGSIDLSTLDGTNGFVINGENEGDYAGFSVASIGDINGDMIDDIVIGAPYAQANKQDYAGKCYVVFGAVGVGASGMLNLASLNGMNGIEIRGADAYNSTGYDVSAAGDVNGDGCEDVIVSAPLAFAGGDEYAGECYVIFGDANVGASGLIQLAALAPADGFSLFGPNEYDGAGYSVSSAGDINGDTIDDLLIGTPFSDPGARQYAGRTYVVFGDANIGATGPINLALLDGSNGFALNGVAMSDSSGIACAALGDVNEDTIDDVLVGAFRADPGAIDSAGAAYVVFGAVGIGAGGALELSSLNGTNGYVLNGEAMDDQAGGAVAGAGDVNGDGVNDILIGASNADPGMRANAGRVYLIYGGAAVGSSGSIDLATLTVDEGAIFNGAIAAEQAGLAVESAGDVNDDGATDITIGAPGAPGGKAYVVFGDAGNPADLSGDGIVNALDLATLIGLWGPCPPMPDPCPADFDMSGDVGAADLAFLIGFWSS